MVATSLRAAVEVFSSIAVTVPVRATLVGLSLNTSAADSVTLANWKFSTPVTVSVPSGPTKVKVSVPAL